MVVLVVERVPDGLRGSIRRWMIEVQAGVFVGRLTQRVRQEVWARVKRESAAGAAMMAWTARCEQGYSIEVHGELNRSIIDMDGLDLISRPRRSRKSPPARSTNVIRDNEDAS
jgi:CRISPR-associated protein Cas2